MSESLLELVDSWLISLAALNRSARTRASYRSAAHRYLGWCERAGETPLTRRSIQSFSAACLESGDEPNTARLRHYALKSFCQWLADENLIDGDPFDKLGPPQQTTKITAAIPDDEVAAILAACRGTRFTDRREEAILRFLFDTGARSSELLAMRVADLDLPNFLASLTKGKGGKGRIVPFGPQTAAALDRYLRMRRQYAPVGESALWISTKRRPLRYSGYAHAICQRAQKAGVTGFHPHRTRNTFAVRWLRAGGSEAGLMSLAGWSTRAMIDRYTAASASERAVAEYRRTVLSEVNPAP